MHWVLLSFLLLASCARHSVPPAESSVAQIAKSSPTSFLQADTASHCFFVPPSGWLMSDPKQLSGRVQISFLKKQEGLCPSINLAIEPTDVSQEDYVQAVQSIHENHHADRWRRLGKIDCPAGSADLTELDMTTKHGPTRLLQLILVRDEKAYIMTAAATKKEIPIYYADFQNAFRSLQITDNLLSIIPDTKRKDSLELLQSSLFETWKTTLATHSGSQEAAFADENFQKNQWTPLETAIMNDYQDLGAHWQILLLKSLYLKLGGTQ